MGLVYLAHIGKKDQTYITYAKYTSFSRKSPILRGILHTLTYNILSGATATPIQIYDETKYSNKTFHTIDLLPTYI